MLKFMRDHLGGTVLFIIVGAISVVFVLWGVFPDSRAGRAMGVGGDVANVGGEHISIREFNEAYERDMNNYRSLGMELPPALLEQVKASTVSQLVQAKLMLVEARRLGVQASDQEVRDEIKAIPQFQDKQTKQFDVNTYKGLLAANHLSTGEFEQRIKDELTNKRLVGFLQSRIRVTPQEVEREYKLNNETRNIEFVRFSRDDAMKKMVADPKAVDAYLKTSDAQVVSYYASNSARYNKDEQVCARHILKKFAKPGDDKATEPPKDFLALKPTTSNFAKLAEKNSDDPGSKAKGGDLDCFPKSAMDKAFAETAFSTPVGTISKPVKSQYGWHYIYVTKKNSPVSIPLDKAKREIAEELVKRDHLDDIRKINLSLADNAMKHWSGEKKDTTGFFNGLEGQIPKIGRADEISKAAFDPNAKIQSGPQLFEAAGGVIVAQVKEKKTADMQKLAADKDKELSTLRERKLRAFLPAWMEDVKKRTKISFNSNLKDAGSVGGGSSDE
jgi:parvulin-like peptidyl-prolyl isomerase